MTNVAHFRLRVLQDLERLRVCLSYEYDIETIEELNCKSWNVLFRAIGENGASYFVKVVNNQTGIFRRSKAVIKLIIKAQYEISRQGFGMFLCPIPSKRGKFVSMCDGLQFLVYQWVHHQQEYQLRECSTQNFKNIERGTKILAKLHQDLLKIPPFDIEKECMPHVLSPSMWAEDYQYLFHQLRSTLMMRNNENISETLRSLDWCERRAKRLVERRSAFFNTSLPIQWVHGDFRPENIVFTVTQCPIVVDWDLMHQSVIMEDVVYAGLCFAGPKWFYGPRDWDAYEYFVDEYLAQHAARHFGRPDLQVSLEWVILKLITCSYKKEQVLSRAALLQDFDQHYCT